MIYTFTFTFSHLADAFVQSDVQGKEYSSYELDDDCSTVLCLRTQHAMPMCVWGCPCLSRTLSFAHVCLGFSLSLTDTQLCPCVFGVLPVSHGHSALVKHMARL